MIAIAKKPTKTGMATQAARATSAPGSLATVNPALARRSNHPPPSEPPAIAARRLSAREKKQGEAAAMDARVPATMVDVNFLE